MEHKFVILGRLDGLNTYTAASQKYIPHFYFDTDIDQNNPRIEVTLTELTAEQAKMPLATLLNDLGKR